MATIIGAMPWYQQRIKELERALYCQRKLTELECLRAESAERSRDRAWHITATLARLTVIRKRRKMRGS